jgi:transcriptional regulator GlxA family with amidase domain
MSTPRCIHFVRYQLEKLGIPYVEVKMGEICLKDPVLPAQYDQLEKGLNELDLFIIQDKRVILTERIKQVIFGMPMENEEDVPKENYSWYISKELSYNYTYLSNLFSETEGITIEHFIIAQKVELVKQLLLQDTFNLTQIANRLHYSSVAHLSSQFKKITGMTASQFRQSKIEK